MSPAGRWGSIKPGRDNRPKGWSQEYVLERLEAGATLDEIYTQAADGHCSVGSIKNEVTAWRDRDERFRLHVEDLLEKMHGTVKIVGKASRLKATPEKLAQFLEEMENAGGNMKLACAAVDMHPGTVLARLDPRSKLYDPGFADRFVTLESERLHVLREKYFQLAESEDERIQERVIWNLLKTRLASIHSEKQQLEVSGSVQHTHTHRLPVVAIEAARAMARESLSRSAHAALPAGDVIDAEVIGEG